MKSEYQVDTRAMQTFLKGLLLNQLEGSSRQWLIEKLQSLEGQPQPKELYLLFSGAPRFVGKDAIRITSDEARRANELREGFSILGWNVAQTTRVLALLAYPYQDQQIFIKILDQLFSTAEVMEQVALYSALPVLPFPTLLKSRAAEGIRTNMTVVFDAVALQNPYPCQYLDEGAWNQMVLKALFMERPIYKILGLDQRCNTSLSKMISDFAHERWAAGRSTSPEMWRPLGNKGPKGIHKDLLHLIDLKDPAQQAAAVLTAQAIDTRETMQLLEAHPEIVSAVNRQGVTWDQLGENWWLQRN